MARQGKEYSPVETWQIACKNQMGADLAQLLQQDPTLVAELHTVYHGSKEIPGLKQREVITYFFFHSGRTITELIYSPFIEAFIRLPICTQGERDLISSIRKRVDTQSQPSPNEIEEFDALIHDRLDILTAGFQYLVLKHNLIPPLSEEELLRRSTENIMRWRNEHPQELEAAQLRGSQAANEMGPRKYTEEIRAQIQEWFDEGKTYKEVVELLVQTGVEITLGALIGVVAYYDDLTYKVPEMRTERRTRLFERVREVFTQNKSRKSTVETLQEEGYTEAQIQRALHELGLRERIDWITTEVTIEGTIYTLQQLMSAFINANYNTITEEYNGFIATLNRNGYEDLASDITKFAYMNKRQHYIKRYG